MDKVLFFIYNIASPLAAAYFLVSFFFSPRRSLLANLPAELKERFCLGRGWKDSLSKCRGGVWVHAASVGEVRSAPLLIKGLRKIHPGIPLLVTTSTLAGKSEALKLEGADCAVLAPLDFYPTVRRFIELLKPSRLVLVETEIWPNLLTMAASGGTGICVANGRMSGKSFRAYRLVLPLMKKILSPALSVCCQTADDASRFQALGADPKSVTIAGNLKYDLLSSSAQKAGEISSFLNLLGWVSASVLTAGSTHPVEEGMLAEAYLLLKKSHPRARLVMAPRHPERAQQAEKTLSGAGLGFVRWSRREKAGPGADPACILLDEMGWLASFYSLSFAAYVGGTFVDKGGHNLLEPAAFSKPVLFGPHTSNTKEAAEMLLATGGGFSISSASELTARAEIFLQDPGFARKSGERSS
ncbi:MAG: glycosyltransferase N-terminal domain-containing protein, partial [bacterium]